MKIWGRMPADLPPTLQRLIARSQRISLPRSCPAPERLRRLRAALCRQRTVRVTYFALPPDVHAAIQELRTIPRGLSPTTTRYGPTGPGPDPAVAASAQLATAAHASPTAWETPPHRGGRAAAAHAATVTPCRHANADKLAPSTVHNDLAIAESVATPPTQRLSSALHGDSREFLRCGGERDAGLLRRLWH